MKLLLCVLLMAGFCGKEIKAAEGNNPETKPESDISSSTKKVLRKIGRKSMDETCELTEDKAKCEKERAEHKAANAADEADTKRREEAKAKAKTITKKHKKAEEVKDTDKTP